MDKGLMEELGPRRLFLPFRSFRASSPSILSRVRVTALLFLRSINTQYNYQLGS
ncbi:MAG: hypothetical protein QOK07_1021, partial [Gemmatimonadaceae bacterium]|nr:hypothetical protein [Gemmatimonadaceae bacterium]